MDILSEAVAALEAVHGASYRFDALANLVGLNSGSSADFTYEELGITYSYGVELRCSIHPLNAHTHTPDPESRK